MSQDTLLVLMTVFVAVSAIALCVQMGLLFGIYKTTRTVETQLIPQAKSILAKADSTLEQSRTHIVEITAKANEMMDKAKVQMDKLDHVLTDAAERARHQLERAELVVDDTVTRVHESVAAVHNGIMRPIREINGVAAGVRTALSYLMRGGRPNVAQATQDDEMFI